MRDELEAEYGELVWRAIPSHARQAGWVVHLDHCIGRIVLDHVFEACWYDHLDRTRRVPAYRQLDDDQLRRAVEVARALLVATPAEAAEANERSLRWRGRRPRAASA